MDSPFTKSKFVKMPGGTKVPLVDSPNVENRLFSQFCTGRLPVLPVLDLIERYVFQELRGELPCLHVKCSITYESNHQHLQMWEMLQRPKSGSLDLVIEIFYDYSNKNYWRLKERLRGCSCYPTDKFGEMNTFEVEEGLYSHERLEVILPLQLTESYTLLKLAGYLTNLVREIKLCRDIVAEVSEIDTEPTELTIVVPEEDQSHIESFRPNLDLAYIPISNRDYTKAHLGTYISKNLEMTNPRPKVRDKGSQDFLGPDSVGSNSYRKTLAQAKASLPKFGEMMERDLRSLRGETSFTLFSPLPLRQWHSQNAAERLVSASLGGRVTLFLKGKDALLRAFGFQPNVGTCLDSLTAGLHWLNWSVNPQIYEGRGRRPNLGLPIVDQYVHYNRFLEEFQVITPRIWRGNQNSSSLEEEP
jgi:hypothetical protein